MDRVEARFLGTLLAIALSIPACTVASSTRGRLDAERDVADGKYRILVSGLPVIGPAAPNPAAYETVLTGCLVSDRKLAYEKAYNAVSISAIRKKFGNAPGRVIDPFGREVSLKP